MMGSDQVAERTASGSHFSAVDFVDRQDVCPGQNDGRWKGDARWRADTSYFYSLLVTASLNLHCLPVLPPPIERCQGLLLMPSCWKRDKENTEG